MVRGDRWSSGGLGIEVGFGPVTLTLWDNPYGFGVVGTHTPQDATPGIHYGDGEKLWGEEKTIIG